MNANCCSSLIDSSASSVTGRRGVASFSSDSNDDRPGGVRVIRILVKGDQWLGPESV